MGNQEILKSFMDTVKRAKGLAETLGKKNSEKDKTLALKTLNEIVLPELEHMAALEGKVYMSDFGHQAVSSFVKNYKGMIADEKYEQARRYTGRYLEEMEHTFYAVDDEE